MRFWYLLSMELCNFFFIATLTVFASVSLRLIFPEIQQDEFAVSSGIISSNFQILISIHLFIEIATKFDRVPACTMMNVDT